jgi:hypothetical protein
MNMHSTEAEFASAPPKVDKIKLSTNKSMIMPGARLNPPIAPIPMGHISSPVFTKTGQAARSRVPLDKPRRYKFSHSTIVRDTI